MNSVASVFLLTLEQNLAFYCADIASRCIFIDYLQLPFEEGLIPLFRLVFYVLEKVDPELYNLVSDDGMIDMPIFATSWILTVYSHDIEKFVCV